MFGGTVMRVENERPAPWLDPPGSAAAAVAKHARAIAHRAEIMAIVSSSFLGVPARLIVHRRGGSRKPGERRSASRKRRFIPSAKAAGERGSSPRRTLRTQRSTEEASAGSCGVATLQ